MKNFIGLLALALTLFTTDAHAQGARFTTEYMQGGQVGLNRASPNMMARYLLGTLNLKSQMLSVKGQYSFAKQGGAIGTIQLLDPFTGLPMRIPANAIIRNCVIDVLTAPLGAGATISISSGKAAADLQAATAVASMPLGLKACIPVGSAATSIKIVADGIMSMVVATGALTAGVFNVLVDFDMSEL